MRKWVVYEGGKVMTLMHDAAWYGRESVVRMLQKIGVDVNIEDNNGWTPMHAAAWNFRYI